MRTPTKTASLRSRYLFGRYIARALDRNGHEDILEIIRIANQAMLLSERNREDAEVLVEEAICDRDFCDREIDEQARTVRIKLAGRGVRAVKEAPYIYIFPNGVGEYVKAPKGEQRIKYTLLTERVEEQLPETDPVRTELVPLIVAKLAQWLAASGIVETQTTQLELKRGSRDAAIAEWEIAVVRVYGQLLDRVGKDKAEHYFPKPRKSQSQSDSTQSDTAQNGAAQPPPSDEGDAAQS